MYKGQTSVEFLILLAIAIFIVTATVIISSEQIGDINALKEQSDAKNAIFDISTAAKEVYAQGEGAKKQVYVVLPSSYEPESSSVEGNAIRFQARGTDYIAVEDFDVHGSLPGAKGAHWIWVISEGNKVRIGYAMLSLSKNSIYVIMDRNASESVTFTAESLWDSDITVSPLTTWSHTDVDMDILPSSSFSLNPTGIQDIDLTFTANENAVGYYGGELRFSAEDASGNIENVKVPITVEVVSYGMEIDPPLSVTPDFWAETMQPNETTSNVFTICTNSFTAPTSISFNPSAGPSGEWVGNTTSLGPMSPDSCQQKTLNLSIPNGTLSGSYDGLVQVVGEGVADAEATISLFVVVEEIDGSSCFDNQSSYCNCPVGSNYWGIALCNCHPATIYVQDGVIVGGPDDGMPYNGSLRGGAGKDVIAGTDGPDIIYTDTTGDIVCGHEGDDIIYGENSVDMLDGGDGNDLIYGGAGGDVIYGKGGDDIIYGGQGDDEIDGGTGNDEMYGEGGKDLIYGGPGDDESYGGANQDLICGNAGADILEGGLSNDELDGGTGSDTLDGEVGNDLCFAGEALVSCEVQSPDHSETCGPS